MIDLVPFTEQDIDRLVSWIETPEELFLWTANGFSFPLTREAVQKLMREHTERGDRLFFKAVEAESGEVVGHLEFGALDRHNRSLRIGRVLVAPAFRGRGVATGMMRAALAFAFGDFGAHRVELGVFDTNTRARACYERVGFQVEGTRREAHLAPGGDRDRFWSEHTMSILDREWEALRARG